MKRVFTKYVSILATILVLLSCFGTIMASAAPYIQVLAPKGQNLVTNGDFEDLNNQDWSFGEGASITGAAKRTGNYGLEMKHMEFDTRAGFEFSQIALAPNKTYEVYADVCTNGLELSCSFNSSSSDVEIERGAMSSSWSNCKILTIKTQSEYIYGKIAFEIYRGGDGKQSAYIDNVSMIATGDEWCPTPTGRMTIGEEFRDSFDASTLDKNRWLVSNTAWGGANGGLNSKNVYLKTVDNRTCCVLESHGDQYTGNVQGVGEMTTRVGAGIVTRDYYASARYEVGCKIEDQLGVCTAFWSFSYVGYQYADASPTGVADEGDGLWQYNLKNNIPENGVRNSEIDWETPSPMDDGGENDVVSHNNLRTNCWGGKRPGEGGNYSGRSHQNNNATETIADGKWHDLVYEWFALDNPYTTNIDNDPAVIWFIDGKRVDGYDVNNKAYIENDKLWRNELSDRPEPMGNFLRTVFERGIEVPRYGTRFWLATWFPVKDSKLYCVGKSAYTGWAGTPDYNTTYTYLDYCNIIPYTNGGTSYAGATGSASDATKYKVKAQYLNDPKTDLGDEYDVIESVPNKQFALPSEYPNYAASVGTLDAPTPVTTDNNNTVTLSWNSISGATAYDIMVDGKVYTNKTSPYNAGKMSIGNHKFKVRAKNATKTGIWSYEALVSVGVPKNVKLTENGHGIIVSWDKNDDAVDYYMEIDNLPMMQNGAYISFTNGDTNCGWLQGFSTGSTHHIRVKAVGANGVSNWSGLKEITITAGGAPIPSLVLKNSDSDPHAFQAIIDRITDATAYQLRDQNGTIIDVPINQWGYPTYDFTNVKAGNYYYSARAYTKGVWSDWSTMQYIAVAPDEILQAPGIHAGAIDSSTNEIYWNDVPKATSYDIELDGKNGREVISNVSNPYRHTGLTEGKTYKYRVRAKNSSQTSDWSSYAYAIPGGSGGGGGGDNPQPSKGDGTLKNGGFDGSKDYWTTDGNVVFENNQITMTAGDVSAILSQTVYGMKPNTEYTFNADITGNSDLWYVYIRNTNGQNNELETKTLPFKFTTGDITENDGVTFIFSVYKQQQGSIHVDNASLTSPSIPTTSSTIATTKPSGSSNPSGIIYGDANDDTKVDMKDVLVVRKAMASVAFSGPYNQVNADANADGKVDMKDVLAIRKFIAYIIPSLGPGTK